jgi:septin family protein
LIHLKLFENFNNKKYFILLVGPPGSGKSYFINKINKNNEYIVINRDDIVVEVSEENGLTYKEMYTKPTYVMSNIDGLYHKFEPEYYEKNGKRYSKGYEKYGEVVEIPIPEIMKPEPGKTWTVFKLINELNDEITRRFNQKFKDAFNSDNSKR